MISHGDLSGRASRWCHDLSCNSQSFPMSKDSKSIAAPLWMIILAMLSAGAIAVPVTPAQISIDGALVLSKTVQYPLDQMMAQFHLGWWTLVNQASALALLMGIHQAAVALLPAVLAIGLMTAAYAMLIYSFTQRTIFSLLAALFCICTGIGTDIFQSPDYGAFGGRGILQGPIGAASVYGLSGAALAVLTIGALAGGRYMLMGFCAAILPCVHLVIGAYMIGLLLLVLMAAYFCDIDLPWADIGKGMMLGTFVTILSFIAYFFLKPPSTPFDATAYATYMKFWDSHRNRPMQIRSMVHILLSTGLLIIGLGAILYQSRLKRIPRDCAIFFIILTTAGSVVLYFAAHALPSALIPDIFLRAIPGRLLNIHAYLSGAIIISVLAYLVAAWLRSLEPFRAGERRLVRFYLSSPAVIGRMAYSLLACNRGLRLSRFAERRLSDAIFVGLLVLFVVAGYVAPRMYAQHYLKTAGQFTERNGGLDDPFWVKVRQSKIRGLILTAPSAYYPSLRFGHLSAAFDPNDFDFVAYLPHLARELARFVEVGFGESFANPPRKLRFHGGLPRNAGRQYWEGLHDEGWRKLARILGVVAIVVPSDWKIALPVTIGGPDFTLYRLPSSN